MVIFTGPQKRALYACPLAIIRLPLGGKGGPFVKISVNVPTSWARRVGVLLRFSSSVSYQFTGRKRSMTGQTAKYAHQDLISKRCRAQGHIYREKMSARRGD